mmetsp:Transcript_3225/g.3150  ORF Transcript_3225/g.3150 Transcript_3225/m.3150 type:complete len:479 (-) Transcript_3225:304-1740(-)
MPRLVPELLHHRPLWLLVGIESHQQLLLPGGTLLDRNDAPKRPHRSAHLVHSLHPLLSRPLQLELTDFDDGLLLWGNLFLGRSLFLLTVIRDVFKVLITIIFLFGIVHAGAFFFFILVDDSPFHGHVIVVAAYIDSVRVGLEEGPLHGVEEPEDDFVAVQSPVLVVGGVQHDIHVHPAHRHKRPIPVVLVRLERPLKIDALLDPILQLLLVFNEIFIESLRNKRLLLEFVGGLVGGLVGVLVGVLVGLLAGKLVGHKVLVFSGRELAALPLVPRPVLLAFILLVIPEAVAHLLLILEVELVVLLALPLLMPRVLILALGLRVHMVEVRVLAGLVLVPRVLRPEVRVHWPSDEIRSDVAIAAMVEPDGVGVLLHLHVPQRVELLEGLGLVKLPYRSLSRNLLFLLIIVVRVGWRDVLGEASASLLDPLEAVCMLEEPIPAILLAVFLIHGGPSASASASAHPLDPSLPIELPFGDIRFV